MTDVPLAWRFGPWAPDLEEAELRARLRALRALAGIIAGPRAAELVEILRVAEALPFLAGEAVSILEGMASLDRRRILASYGAIMRTEATTRAAPIVSP